MREAEFTALREADQLHASAVIEFQRAWLNVRRSYVKVVTTKELYGNVSKWQQWVRGAQGMPHY